MSKITDCFLLDNTEGAYLAVYDADKYHQTYLATRYGYSSQTGSDLVKVPLHPFTDVEVHDRCVLLLLEAAKAAGWRRKNAYEDAEDEFMRRDLRFHNMLSSADHHLIPQGQRIAVAEPEYLGRIVVSGNQRGVVLFNAAAVIGYKGRGRTAFEHVLDDNFLAATG